MNRLEKIKKKLLADTACMGVELALLPDNHMAMNAVALAVEKDVLRVKARHEAMESVQQLKTLPGADLPVHLVIHGKGILHRRVAGDTDSEAALLQAIFPNAKAEDFYLQKLPAHDNGHMVSLVRRNVLDEIVESFRREGFPVVEVSLGPFCLQTIQPYLVQGKPADYEINLGGHRLIYRNGLIESCRQGELANKNFSVAGETMSEKMALAFAAAYGCLFKEPKPWKLDVPAVNSLREEWQEKKKFKLLGWGSLIFFLGILLLNFLVFTHLNSRLQQLTNRMESSKDEIARLEKMKKEIREKEKFLSETGWLKPSQTTFYSDRLAESVPENILLTELIIYPTEKNVKPEEKKLLFNPSLITVSGLCSRSVDLNEWVKKIRRLPWAKSVVVQQYTQNSGDEKGNFTLEIGI